MVNKQIITIKIKINEEILEKWKIMDRTIGELLEEMKTVDKNLLYCRSIGL